MAEPILIVGAGPTGLVMALRLRRHGVPFRLIDRNDAPGRESRALAMHARTLEFYRQLGLADRLIAQGTVVEAVRLREAGEEVARIPIGEIGEGLSPYPFVLGLPQDEHEALLVDALAAEGVAVERGTELVGLAQDDAGVAVTLRHGGSEERARYAYVLGCDGARSAVREALGIGFPGGTYERLYYVADVRLAAEVDRDFAVALDRDAFALRLPSRKGRSERLIGYVPRGAEAAPDFAAVRPEAERLLGVRVADLHWFSTYRVHHRVAARFREGGCFLLGDAGHVHSPVGGQGMNTGIGDAVNLSWKLAQVVQGRADAALLDTYEPERIAFARALVATTDRVFGVIADSGWVGRVFRGWVMPHVVPLATATGTGRRGLFRLVSQIRVAYPDGALSEGEAGAVVGGARLPWLAGADNFAPLASLAWQVHTFGGVPRPFADAAAALGLELHVFAWDEAARGAGFAEGAAYLVRPDGHVGLAMARPEPAVLDAYARRHGLRFGAVA